MWDLLLAPFMIRAVIAAAVTGLAAPGMGTYLVQRRLSLMGDGIGHICVTGVALGLLTGTSPTYTAVVVAVVGALLIELIRTSGKATGDLALALLFYGGIAGGLVLVQLAGNGAFALQAYLFGSITTISSSDVVVSVVLAGIVIVVGVALMPQLFAVSHDEDFARAGGVPVRFYNMLVSVLAAVTVAVAMRTVGLLLVSALMIIPVATSQQFARSFRTTMFGAMLGGLLASLGGVVVSAFLNLPPGATIVLVALAGFVATVTGGDAAGQTAAGNACRSTPAPRCRSTPRPTRTTATSTARAADTSRSSTATTSTTSTTATGTPSTSPGKDATMTSTEPPRTTPQRQAVLDALGAVDDFRSAQEVHELLAARGSGVGLATVYRTLALYADHGLVDVLRREDGEAIYRRCSDTHHHHLVCRSCGATVEVEGPAVERWTSAIASEHGFSDLSHTLEIVGTCGACSGG